MASYLLVFFMGLTIANLSTVRSKGIGRYDDPPVRSLYLVDFDQEGASEWE